MFHFLFDVAMFELLETEVQKVRLVKAIRQRPIEVVGKNTLIFPFSNKFRSNVRHLLRGNPEKFLKKVRVFTICSFDIVLTTLI